MKKIGGVLEGLILLAIGLYAILLVFFGDYWRFLNPKFKWLTAFAAVSMAALMIVNFTDIVGTKFFLRSVPGALDISEELMVVATLHSLANEKKIKAEVVKKAMKELKIDHNKPNPMVS